MERSPLDAARLLAMPFPASEIAWKPQSVSGNRCLAIAYIDARTVMHRLDEVVGVENWSDDYETLGDGTILCRLQLWIGGRWIAKSDAGGFSGQPDAGDRGKAAVSDALKRAAVKWGVGRYLHALPLSWVDYDPKQKRIVNPPNLPDWALPPVVKADPFAGAMKILTEAARRGGLPTMDLAWKALSTEMRKAVEGTEALDNLAKEAESICPRAPTGKAVSHHGR